MEKCDFQAAFEAGRDWHPEVMNAEDGGIPFIVTPAGMNLVGVSQFMPEPPRKKGLFSFAEAESFVAFVNRHKVDGETMLYVLREESRFQVQAVFDDNPVAGARWREHRALFSPITTVGWDRWAKANRVPMAQAAFAAFIEENIEQIVKPSGAELLEIARRLEATTSVQFTSGVRLDNGNAELRYEETTEAKAGTKGALAVPSEFSIGVQLFQGGPGYEIRARLRYRIQDKALKLWFELVNPHLMVRDATDEIMKMILAETGLNALAVTAFA